MIRNCSPCLLVLEYEKNRNVREENYMVVVALLKKQAATKGGRIVILSYEEDY